MPPLPQTAPQVIYSGRPPRSAAPAVDGLVFGDLAELALKKLGDEPDARLLSIRPMEDRLLVRHIDEPDKLIVLVREDPHSKHANAGDYRREILRGEVIAVGPGRLVEAAGRKGYVRRPVEVKPKQQIYFTDWNDWDAAPTGYSLIREGDIIGICRADRAAGSRS